MNILNSPKNLIGQQFNRLFVVGYAGKSKWICQCLCGNRTTVNTWKLKSGHTKSCGCLSIEQKSSPHPERRKPDSLLQILFKTYQRRATEKKLKCTITFAHAKTLFKSNCYYCGAGPSNTRIGKTPGTTEQYNGIDRINSNKGYIKANVVPCCWICNRAKRNMSITQFQDWIKRLCQHNQWSLISYLIQMKKWLVIIARATMYSWAIWLLKAAKKYTVSVVSPYYVKWILCAHRKSTIRKVTAMAERTVDVVAKKIILVCDRCCVTDMVFVESFYQYGAIFYRYQCPTCYTTTLKDRVFPYIEQPPIKD